MSSAQGARNSSFSHFFPTAAKRKAAKERQKSTQETNSDVSHAQPSTDVQEQQTSPTTRTRRPSNSGPNVLEHPVNKLSPSQDPGDLLNGVGSASSLASTSSSIFSTTAGAKSNVETAYNSLTPLTNHESSPPESHPSPKHKIRPLPANHANQIHESSNSSKTSAASTSEASAMAQRLARAMPGPGEPRSSRIVYDPDLDSTLAMKDKRKAKPRYEPLAEEV